MVRLNWLEQMYAWWWFHLNSSIFSQEDVKFLLRALKWKHDWLDTDSSDFKFSENLYNWFKGRSDDTYSAKWPIKKVLDRNEYLHRQHSKQIETENSRLLKYAMELALMDLIRVLFSDKWVKVIKCSNYDQIKCSMDYILVWPQSIVWLDIIASSNLKTIDKSRENLFVIPIEFNVCAGSEYELSLDSNWWHKIIIDRSQRTSMKKIVIPLEPNLAQLFFSHYLETVSSQDNLSKMSLQDVLDTWNYAVEEYKSGNFERSWYFSTKSSTYVCWVVKSMQKELVSALNWTQ